MTAKRAKTHAAAPPERPATGAWWIVAASVGMQAAAWGLLFGLTRVLRIGYDFFDMSDIRAPYHVYASLMARGYVPFRDFPIEYPPLFPPLLLAAGFTPDVEAFVARFAFEMVLFAIAAGAVATLTAVDGPDSRRPLIVAGVFALSVLALGAITANRYDAAVAFVIALAILFMARRRWVAAAVALGVGFALKITPVILLPLVFVLAPRKRMVPAFAGFAVAAAAPFAAVLALGGMSSSALSNLITYHLDRPLEIESVPASFFWLQRLIVNEPVRIGLASGSQVVVSQAADALARSFGAFLAVTLVAVLALVWVRRGAVRSDPASMVLAALAIMLASLVGSKVLSPQYFIWLLPAVALVAVDRKLLAGLLLAAMALTHLYFPAYYWTLVDIQPPWLAAVVVLRNVLLVAAFALSMWYLWKLPSTPPVPAKGAAGLEA